jgi:hypothetical protein
MIDEFGAVHGMRFGKENYSIRESLPDFPFVLYRFHKD